MPFDSERYTHDADRAALRTLRNIPGFSALVKGFMNIWSEPQQKILNMSSRIRLGEKQMKHYYDMLPPICEKLGIEVPELYLEMDVLPNAYTSGDTHPFIVMTSGLLETLPDELIPTVLAHECGHIACHHVLYHTMGTFVLNGAVNTIARNVPFGGLLTIPLQIAFYYWMRCSEFSADRAAVLCDGTAEKQQEVCMRLAGWDKDIIAEASMEEFLKQAESYVDMINGSSWNRTLEFMILANRTHPLMALRATECGKWARTDEFSRILRGDPPVSEDRSASESESPASLQSCTIEDAELRLPEEYKKAGSFPDDPPKAVNYALNTEGARVLISVYPRSKDQGMKFEYPREAIAGIHETLKDNQGLIEVKSGKTAAGKQYIYSIVKTVMKENNASCGVLYSLVMDLEYADSKLTIRGFFEENGPTGTREAAVYEVMRKENKVIMTDTGVTGWSQDPYDPAFTKGIPMNESEKTAYDELFPLHPLSEARKLIKALIRNN